MEGSSAYRRSLHRGILVTEPVRTAVKKPSKRENRQPSTSFAQPDEIPSSPSMNLRSKMKERVRRSLPISGGESPVLKRKVDTNFRAKVISERKRALPLIEDLDDITPRTLLKKIIQNENEVSLVVSQRSKAAAADDGKPENSPTAQLSGMGDVNLSLPELDDTEYVTVMRKAGKKRKLRISEFEREVDKRLTMNNDNDNVSLDSFASSSSRANSYTLSRPFETKLDNSAVPETTFKKVLSRRPNKVYMVSVDDFEQGVDDKYQRLKGSQECFIPPAMEDRSETSSNNLALMSTELHSPSLRKDVNTPTSENRKQRRASKLFLSSRDEIKEASGELSERGTRKLKANDRSTEENVIKQFRGDQSKVIEDSDGGEDSEDNIVHVSDQAVDNSSKDGADVVHGSSEIGDDSSDDGADDVHGSSEVENDNGEDNADDGHAAGEDEADVVHGSKEVTDDDGEDEADDGYAAGKDDVVHASGEITDDSSEDEADVVHGSGEVTDDSEDEADDGNAAGKDDVVHASGENTDDSSEDEADDAHAAGEDGADVVHGSGEVTDDDVSEVEADDGYAAGKDDVVHASGEITDDSSEDEADDAHAAGEDGADVVRGSGEVMDDSSEDEADDAHAAGEDGADVVRGSGEVMDDSSEDEADDAHAAGEDGADVVHGSGEVTDDSEVEADDGYAAGKDDVVHASGEITDDSSEDEADDAHAAGKDDVVHASGEITDDSSEDEADDAHAAGEDGAVVVHGSGEITDDSSEDEADDAHAAGEDGAVVVHGSGEITDDSSEDEADDAHAAGEYGAGVVHGSGEDDSDEDDIDEADDVRVEAKVADDLPDDESNMQPNKSSVTHSNRKSAGIADYSHPEQRTRLSSKLSYGNNMKTADSIHLQSVSVSRSEQGSELLETTGDESLDLAMFREIKKVESNQLVLEELPEPPPYLKSVHSARRAKPAPVRKKIQRTKSATPKKSGSALKSSQVKQIFNRHAQVRVSKEALTDVEKCLDLYMDQVASDLGAYAAHAKRKTITRADMELLMKRQRLVTDTTSLNVLIEKHLPMECRKLLIPCAKSGNQVFPKL
ncbi:centromere protein T [Ranitomeya imitator]|uniref:centromere protein T n=1 Tax=Ranitomeya imitator TaxID=111125 RepID=UPI0037E998E0